MISFKCSKEEFRIIHKIASRAVILFMQHGVTIDPQSMEMDITATHANGCPLRLYDLLATDDFNFLHDVAGIRRHINRKTGQLEDCFTPRFANSQS